MKLLIYPFDETAWGFLIGLMFFYWPVHALVTTPRCYHTALMFFYWSVDALVTTPRSYHTAPMFFGWLVTP